MSKDSKKKIDETKSKFLKEIDQDEQDILNEVAGGNAPEDTTNKKKCVNYCSDINTPSSSAS